jgi:RNA polymerase subunit RPABC4/transcription elongation factor Spt4
MADETRICDSCDTEIGKTEKVCPKCQANQEENDELADAVSKGSSIIKKREERANKNKPAPAPAPEPEKKSKSSRLREIGRMFKRNA